MQKAVCKQLSGLTENSLIQIVTPEGATVYRALRLTLSTNSATVIDTNLRNRKAKPTRVSIDVFLASTDARAVTILDKEIFLEIHTYRPESEDKQKRDRYWKCFEPYLNDPRLLDERKWSVIVLELSKELSLGAKQTRNLLRRWIQTGFAKNAVGELKFLMGGKGKPKNQSSRTIRLGPYTKDDKDRKKTSGVLTKSGIPITAEVDAQFRAAERKYRKGLRNAEGARRPTIEQAYQWLLEHYYKEKDGQLRHLTDAPSKRQFANWLHINIDPVQAARDRLGRAETDLNNRAKPGRAVDFAPEAGEKLAFDSTIIDDYVRSSTNPNLPVRRPRLYQGVDFNSNYRLTPYLTLEDESYSTIAEALATMFTSPVDLLAKYNIHVSEDEVPHFVPSVVVTDRLRTYLGDQMADAKDNLKFALGRPEAFRGDKKGPVEGSFDQLNEAVISQLPGYVSKERQRDGKPPEATSLLTFEELYEIILLETLRWNTYEPQTHYPEDEGMTADDIVLTPLNILLHRHHKSGALRTETPEKVYQYLLPHEPALMTNEGLLFRTLRYTGKFIQKRDWMNLAATKGSFPVEISYYGNSTTYVFLRPDTELGITTFEKCELIDSSDMDKFRGVTFTDVANYRDKRHATERHQQQDRRQSIADRNARIDKITAEGKERASKASELPSPQNNIATETAQERDRMRRNSGDAWDKRWEDQPSKSDDPVEEVATPTVDPTPQERTRIDFAKIRQNKQEQSDE